MFRELLASEFAPYGKLDARQLDRLEAHYNLLTKWNERINLTRIRNLEDIVRLHYCESLFVATVLPPGALRIVDVGSGAGFPGIPIAIARPECTVTLVESHQRKAVFLRESSRNLSNIKVLSSRAEDLKEKFDWLVSRALAPNDVQSLRLAENAAILLGERDATSIGEEVRKFPWGKNRAVALFHVEQFHVEQ